ncbi:MAG TPA: PQQ-dependent sugar dehydrogenase [Candidatus Limnocylindrales bacterium]
MARTGGTAVHRLIALATLLLLALALAPAAAADSFSTTLVKDGFTQPVFVTNAGDSRLFVVQQNGLIQIIEPDNSVKTFLDLSSQVLDDGEEGLLGLAFHPNYASNGLFYVYYTPSAGGAEVLAEFKRSAGDPDAADPNSERILLTLSDPYANHNGGWMAFKGNYLYLSLGDGGSGGDPQNRAQNLNQWWGKILRINPLDPDGSGPKTYSIPTSNPFVGRPGKNEIWSYGLRNAWRCSFDDLTGKLWCGDVGQDSYEEVDRVRTGKAVNFGWHRLEGRHYYTPAKKRGQLCTSNCLTMPILDYAHSAFGGGNCAVTGGYVSRRSGAAMAGHYTFGDYCSGKVWVIPSNFKAGSTLPSPIADTDYSISSFGEGADGRIYLVDLNGGIYLIDQS